MAITDERTPRLDLQLPFKTNALKDDVERIRQSLTALDTKVATIGDDGKVPLEQLPSIALAETYPVDSQAAMLALDAQPGSLAIRSDVSKTFVLMALPASTLTNWKEMLNDALIQLSGNDGLKLVGAVSSYAELKTITPSFAGQLIELRAYNAGWAALANGYAEGGGKFIAVNAAGVENGGTICVPNSSTTWHWKRIFDGKFTPEMFGAIGDGNNDDRLPIQNMLDAGPLGCKFVFNGSKTYYNAFGNKTTADAWIDLSSRYSWKRSIGAVFEFNGAKLTRRFPIWNSNNAKNNMNSGIYYTDDHTALLWLTGSGYKIDGANFHSNVPIGTMLNSAGVPTSQTNYAVGECLDFGLRLDGCTDVTITNSRFTNSVFPIYAENCENITMDKVDLRYAAQAAKRITPTDIALGGGVKLISTSNVRMTNIYGYRNANDTVEIEPYNKNIYVQGSSDYDYSNSIVIFGSQHVRVEWAARNVVSGVGLYIRGGYSTLQTKFISGNIVVDTCSWAGVLIYLADSAANDIFGIKLDIQTSNCALTGLYIDNESATYKIRGVDIKHLSVSDAGGAAGTGYPCRWHGKVSGKINIDVVDAYQGFWASGSNTTDCVMAVSGNIRDAVSYPWTISSAMYVDIDGLISKTNTYRLTSTQFIDIGAIAPGGGYENTNSYVRTFGRFNQEQTTYGLHPKMKSTQSGSAYELLFDAASGTPATGGTTYTVKLFVPSP